MKEQLEATPLWVPAGKGRFEEVKGYLFPVDSDTGALKSPGSFPFLIGLPDGRIEGWDGRCFVSSTRSLTEKERAALRNGQLTLAELGVDVVYAIPVKTSQSARSGASPDVPSWRIRQARYQGVVPQSTLAQTVELPDEDRQTVEARQAAFNSDLDKELGTARAREVVIFEDEKSQSA